MNGFGASLRDAWWLARPYFADSGERWSARGLLAAVVGLNLALVGLSVLLNGWRGEFYNAIGAKDWDAFISLILLYHRSATGFNLGFTVLAGLHVVIIIYEYYLTQMLKLRWRRWLTGKYVNDWLADRAYYKISLTAAHGDQGTDNPDQRITEDIRDFCDTTLDLGVRLISRVVSLVSFLTILWGLSRAIAFMGMSIPGYLFWVALIYAAIGTVCTHFVGRPLTALVFRQQRVEADFRYSLFRVRENVEGIALYHGESEEKASLLSRFGAVFDNFRAIMSRTRLLNMVTGIYGQASAIFPIVLVAPGYFAGKFPQGVIFQTTGAFSEVESALSYFVNVYETLATWRAIVGRLGTFHRSIEAAHQPDTKLIRSASADGTVRLRGVDLSLPNGTKLLDHADLTLNPGHSVVITGRSGSGKSTLFRLLSGIWPFATGHIDTPAGMFFLPQRPYIPLGTLRRVITYPNDSASYGQPALETALRDCGLEHLIPRLDADDNWPQSLSGGEQQRVAIARALLAKPSWIFMDEATANLDPDSETAVYRMLRERLPETTLISIAHRPSVADFHDGRVVFRREGGAPGQLVTEART